MLQSTYNKKHQLHNRNKIIVKELLTSAMHQYIESEVEVSLDFNYFYEIRSGK